MGTFLIGQKGFIHLLSMADTDYLDLILWVEQLPYSLSQNTNSASRSLLYHNITTLAILEGENHQIYRFLQAHDKSGHLRFCNRNRFSGFDLLDPQRDNGAAGTHNISISGTAYFGFLRRYDPRLGHNYLFHHSLGGSHGIDRVSSLVRRQADHSLYSLVNGRCQHIVGSYYICFYCFQREKLAGWNLL